MNKPTRTRWKIAGLLCMVATVNYFQRVNISVAADPMIGSCLEMEGELVVEVVLESPPAEERPSPGSQSSPHGQASSGLAPSAEAMASTSRSQPSASDFSWRRPAAVSW